MLSKLYLTTKTNDMDLLGGSANVVLAAALPTDPPGPPSPPWSVSPAGGQVVHGDPDQAHSGHFYHWNITYKLPPTPLVSWETMSQL